jgi:hypothetical protein
MVQLAKRRQKGRSAPSPQELSKSDTQHRQQKGPPSSLPEATACHAYHASHLTYHKVKKKKKYVSNMKQIEDVKDSGIWEEDKTFSTACRSKLLFWKKKTTQVLPISHCSEAGVNTCSGTCQTWPTTRKVQFDRPALFGLRAHISYSSLC